MTSWAGSPPTSCPASPEHAVPVQNTGGHVNDAEVIVVGGGHNGLICGSYLSRSGIDTLLLESRPDVGGCTSTVSDLGARFNICHCDHTLIRAMPISDELSLADHGLRYVEPGAGAIFAFHDGGEPWAVFHDAEQTVDGLAASYPHQVNAYRRYLRDAMPVAELVIAMAGTVPSARRFAGVALRRGGRGMARLLDWSRSSASEVLGRYFDDWHLSMPGITVGPSVWGLPPGMPGTGLAAINYASRHLVRSGRPVGGSGALTDSLRASMEAAGGRVRCDSRVERLIVDDGRVAGVRLTDGTSLRADVVVAACDPARVFVDWLGDPPAAARRCVDRWRNMPISDGYESKIDAVLTGRPTLAGGAGLAERHPDLDQLGQSMYVSPSPAEVADAHVARSEGRVAEIPTLLSDLPSVTDPTMAPGVGRHVLSLEVLFTPYSLMGGWDGSGEPERWLELWAGMMEPGALDLVDSWRVMTPNRYENEFTMHRGHTPSCAVTPLAAFLGRPRETTRYRTPVRGLYLSGAGTFPGAGVVGAAGRNPPEAVHSDLRGTSLIR